MNRLDALKAAVTKPDLARLLGVKPSFLTYVLYVLNRDEQYHSFDIQKKSGGTRTILAPSESLKSLQSLLSELLQDCLGIIVQQKKDSDKSFKHTLSHGFVREKSIVTNALQHVKAKNVLNVDLKDFFDSFNFGRVRGFFIKNRNFQLSADIATVIAQIACHDNKLPQGSPSSPVISNLIAHPLDVRLAKLANKYSCRYSRYADDITISTRERIFPEAIMGCQGGNYTPGERFLREIDRAGFSLNMAKTRILFKDSRREITGLVSNEKPNVKNEYRKPVRAQCHRLFETGKFYSLINGVDVEGDIKKLEGKLNFIDHLDHFNRVNKVEHLNPHYQIKNHGFKKDLLLSGREKILSRFLFYRYFYANPKPTILCEGQTDNIYLDSAIRRLKASFPDLIEQSGNGEGPKLRLKLFEYTGRTRFLLNLSGGASYITNFVNDFKKNYDCYGAPRPKHPIVIVMDNDEGFDDMPGKLKKIGAVIHPKRIKKNEYRHAEFIHVYKNLYIVLTPLLPVQQYSAIESLFDSETLATPLGKKTFSPKNKIDPDKEYGKFLFASKVVEPNKETIEFSGFSVLLKRVVACVRHYRSLV